MKNQALSSSKDKSKKLKCRLLQFLFRALRVNSFGDHWPYSSCDSLNVRKLFCELTAGKLSHSEFTISGHCWKMLICNK